MRLAVFGGTFDPIHNAHLVVAQEAAQAFSLDEVLLVPAAHPPHKDDDATAPFEDRYRMVELACSGHSGLVPSRLEEGQGKSYSIDTVSKLAAERQTTELYFIIGADAFAEITTWHRWRDLAGLVVFLVVGRPVHTYEVPDGVRVERLNTLALPVSSSSIRHQLAIGERPSDLPLSVFQYICEHRLYLWDSSKLQFGKVQADFIQP